MRKEAMLYSSLDSNRVHCYLCSHECKISDSKLGKCGVRQNIGGKLYSLVYAAVIADNVDPIEKKPLFHFLPGTTSYSIATMGCNFKCDYCQNWNISQIMQDIDDKGEMPYVQEMMPEQIVERAKQYGCASISYTYTEPTIFFEYAYDTAKLAKEAGLYNIFVTNGFMTKRALDTIRPYLDAANIDLKSFRNEYYKEFCKARVQPVIDTIAYMQQLGLWIEITTLIVPGENDSDEELNQIAGFISELDNDIPWHISRFRPDYKLMKWDATPPETMRRAKEIGRQNGLHYLYLGNLVEDADTNCYQCGSRLIQRKNFAVKDINLKQGLCPVCGKKIKGFWEDTVSVDSTPKT